MRKITILVAAMAVTAPLFGQIGRVYKSALFVKRNDSESSGFLYTAKDNNIVTDLSWQTFLLVGKSTSGGFEGIESNYANELVEKIDIIINFRGKTENISPFLVDCGVDTRDIELDMNKIGRHVMQDQTKPIADLFAGNDIEKLELILKVKYRNQPSICPSALHYSNNTDEEMFTVEIAYFGARFLLIDLAGSPTDANTNWSQFAAGLSYTQATVGTNFSNKLAAVFTSPVFSFRSPNWFLNHFDIEYLITSIETGEGGQDKVVTGMGGCFGFIGRNTKGIKLGIYRNTETEKWFPVLAIGPSIFKDISNFITDGKRRKNKWTAK